MIRPLSKHVLLELDPIPAASKTLHIADEDWIKYCTRCPAMMEALNGPCKRPREEWSWDKRTGRRPIFEGRSYAHEIRSVRAPAHPPRTRTGVIIALNGVRDLSLGARVLIDASAGADPLDENKCFENQDVAQYRIVHEDAILGEVELD